MTPKEREVMEQALEALEKHGDAYLGHSDEYQFAITKVKEALAKQEQEPVVVMELYTVGWDLVENIDIDWLESLPLGTKLYTTPSPVPEAHKRKPLTDAQLEKGREQTFSINNPFCPCDSKTFRKVARWVEAAHDIKE